MLFSEALICISLLSGVYYIYVCLRLIGLGANFSVISSLFGFPWWLSGKESTCNAEDPGSILGLGRSPGGGYGNPLQYSCLENPLDRGDCRAPAHRVAQSWRWLK